MGNCCLDNRNSQPLKHQRVEEENGRLANTLKEKGNEHFKNREFKEAIQAYTEAIHINDQCSIFYSNRAVAYKALNDYQLAMGDAEEALKLDGANARAQLVKGTILLIEAKGLQSVETCISGLKLCETGLSILDLAKRHAEQRPCILNPVEQNLEMGRKLQKKLQKLQGKLEYKKLLQTLSKLDHNCVVDFEFLSRPLREEEFELQCESFVCAITQETMKNPVILQTGHSYEQEAILECLRVNGQHDPKTREVVSNVLIPNRHLQLGAKMLDDNIIEFQ